MLTVNENDELYTAKIFVRKIQKRALISGLFFGILITLFWTHSAGYGFLSGLAIGIVNFQLMSVDSFVLLDKSPQKARKFIIGRYIIRSAIMFGFIALIVTKTEFNIITAFFGIFYVKFLLIGEQVIQAFNLTGKTS
ncbi:ATP synthase subunit I [Candidatus Latescibacterota bacterium]